MLKYVNKDLYGFTTELLNYRLLNFAGIFLIIIERSRETLSRFLLCITFKRPITKIK